MSGLIPEEKQFIGEALQLYLQYASQQMSPQQLEILVQQAQAIIHKLDTLGTVDSDSPMANKPAGISEEWFTAVCQSCDKLSPSGCKDSVTAKFPGKCDPILKYEFQKIKR